ncbi:hydroperoxide isomerase ALOXE3-like [Ambystoma mexicanum]|uniref:hydroperoxide isomerase ALOXE3-like n=1 Tax=Ambystoma mexicanum TaxID=8296 RepID=UPI0037E8E0D9
MAISSSSGMSFYRVKVKTSPSLTAGSFDSISITLVGSRGESPKHPLQDQSRGFIPGAQDECIISSNEDLGDILLIRLHKEPYCSFPESSWYCSYITVQCPRNKMYHFPCYVWIEGYRTVEIREGTAQKAGDDTNPLLQQHRKLELKSRQESYRWREFWPGTPRCVDINSATELNSDSAYSLTKAPGQLPYRASHVEIKLKGLCSCQDTWKTMEDIHRVFCFTKTPVSEFVSQHWKEDTFFGYQFLNGANPVLIRKCTEIPSNFPVTEEMVAYTLWDGTSLRKELQKGNIFIVDYKILEGVPARIINGRQQYIAAPMCLLYRSPDNEMIPIAIQIGQIPGPETPIFLPSDSEWDWTLAKIWVRNSDLHLHQVVSHLLRTHLWSEVFCVATIRQLPACHPLYKLLIPHMQGTLQINILARTNLISPGGNFDRVLATGQGGIPVLLQHALESLTYCSLCLPDDLKSRQVLSLPQYYYRDDGLEVWSAIESFVAGIVGCFFKSDASVQKDHELQAWVAEIFREGFLERKSSGVPHILETCADLVKYLTMVIFTCSAQHAVFNSSQFDFCSWMPNAPVSMRNPPPSVKGRGTMESVLETLPEVSSTCTSISVFWMLTRGSADIIPLGSYSEEYFTEEEPKRWLRDFRVRLEQIASRIEKRNESLNLKYNYLNPRNIENSIFK